MEARGPAAGIDPPRRIYDLRHTYATMSLAAGVSLFSLARRMLKTHDQHVLEREAPPERSREAQVNPGRLGPPNPE